jgi:hypothetical protein
MNNAGWSKAGSRPALLGLCAGDHKESQTSLATGRLGRLIGTVFARLDHAATHSSNLGVMGQHVYAPVAAVKKCA